MAFDPMSLIPGIGSVAATITGGINSLLQHDANVKNLQFQKDTLEYQKAMQGKTWEREDNAVQRRAADLTAAGMSKTLAAGSAAQSQSPVSVLTPQMQASEVKIDPMTQAQAIMAMLKAQQDIRQSAAQAALTQLQAEDKQIEVNWQRKTGIPTSATSGTREGAELMAALFGEGSPFTAAVGNIANKVGGVIGKLPIGNVLKKAPIIQKIAIPAIGGLRQSAPKLLEGAKKVVPKLFKR